VSTEELAVGVAAARKFGLTAVPRRGALPRSEAALVRAAQRGDAGAVEELFRRHWPAAFRAAWLVTGDRAAAEDVAQDAFLAAVRALGSFDRRRPLAPWLHRIAVNRAIDWTRARARAGETAAEHEPAAADSELAGGLDDDLVAALRTLSPDHRAVIVLRYLLDHTPGEIAAALGVPRGTVNSRLRRGLDALARVLEEDA
jgi:RNA polymerase sigma-70 factor (ECF subfamily)